MILAVSGTGKLGRRVVRVRGRESASMPRPRASPAFTHRRPVRRPVSSSLASVRFASLAAPLGICASTRSAAH
jgi:hypothetical protein